MPISKSFSQFMEDGEGGVPANNAGAGNIAGIGVGPKGEPGVDLRKKRKQFGEDGVTVTTEGAEEMMAKRLKELEADDKTDSDEYRYLHKQVFEATSKEVEAAAAAVHQQWMDKQKKLGHDEHLSPDGEEDYMVPFHKLSDDAKDLDRGAVKAVLSVVGESSETWKRGDGYDEGKCQCGDNCSTHPDASDPLEFCADCGDVTCSCCTKHSLNAPFCAKCQKDPRNSDRIFEERETFAGAPVFEVDMDRVMSSRFGKNRYHRYSKYVGNDASGEEIRQHGRSTGGDIVLKDSATAVMTYLRRKKQ